MQSQGSTVGQQWGLDLADTREKLWFWGLARGPGRSPEVCGRAAQHLTTVVSQLLAVLWVLTGIPRGLHHKCWLLWYLCLLGSAAVGQSRRCACCMQLALALEVADSMRVVTGASVWYLSKDPSAVCHKSNGPLLLYICVALGARFQCLQWGWVCLCIQYMVACSRFERHCPYGTWRKEGAGRGLKLNIGALHPTVLFGTPRVVVCACCKGGAKGSSRFLLCLWAWFLIG